MPRVGLKGFVAQFDRYTDAVPVLDWLMAQIENAMNGQLDSTNIATSGIGTAQIADGSVTTAKVASGTLTPSNMADGVGQVTSGSYTGDGTTANRVISVVDPQGNAFTPRYVLVVRADSTFVEFISIQEATLTLSWSRAQNGQMGSATTDWQGIVTNGFKLGSSATGASNVLNAPYRYVAYK